ncbi:MAG: ribonuclease P protein component [Burkholderiales bacterium]
MRWGQRLQAEAVQLALSKGKTRRGEYFRLYFRVSGLVVARIALIVSKRNAPRAVDRSRVRRLIRETFRKEQDRWRGVDCVIRLAGGYSSDHSYGEDLIRLFRRAP